MRRIHGGKIVEVVRQSNVSVYCLGIRKKGCMNPGKNHEVEVENLHKLVDCLQKENRQLKELLE